MKYKMALKYFIKDFKYSIYYQFLGFYLLLLGFYFLYYLFLDLFDDFLYSTY